MKLALFLIFAATAALHAQIGAGGIITGERSAFMLTAPEDWVLDLQLAQHFGVSAAFRRAEPKDDQGVLIYSFSATKGADFHSLKEYLAFNRSKLEQESPKISVQPAADIKAISGRVAQVHYYSGLANGRFESGAYFDTPEAINLIVMTAPNEEAFQKELSSFNALVASYVGEATVVHEKEQKPESK